MVSEKKFFFLTVGVTLYFAGWINDFLISSIVKAAELVV
jgi:hypothetical protein